MTINVLVPHLKISGGLRAMFSYSNLLAARGHEVRIFVQSAAPVRRFAANLLGRGPRWIRDFAPRTIRVRDFTADAVPDADVILLDSWTVAARGLALPARCGAPVNIVQHDERLYHGPPDAVAAVYRSPCQKVVISRWLQERFERDFDVSPPVLVTPVDFGLFHPVDGLRKPDKVRVLLLQHSYAWKGTEEGLRAIEELKAEFPQIETVMFGVRGEHPGSRCDEYHFSLPQECLAELYSSCDIYLCPSWDEGLGMPSMEAMACGTALVTYDNGGSRDYAFHEQTALVARRRDTDDLRAQLRRMIEDSALRARLSDAGRAHIHALPTWPQQAEALERILLSHRHA